MDHKGQLNILLDYIADSNHTIVLTGAGMSTESGIPDFRSNKGWYQEFDPARVATADALRNDYETFHRFYCLRIKLLSDCEPHEGHRILAKWEARGLIQAIATQNVDGFHQLAGSQQVDELHGNLRTARCETCEQSHPLDAFIQRIACSRCGGRLRPNIVLFDEALPEETWQSAITEIRRSDLVIVIGTSLQVYPANRLPWMGNGKVVLINADEPSGDSTRSDFDLIVRGMVKEVLVAVDDKLPH